MQGKKPSFRWTLLAIVAVMPILSSGFLVAQEKILYTFHSGHPDGLIFDAVGNLYGTTIFGGMQANAATAFELSPTSGGGWSKKTLHIFESGSEFSNLTFDAAGNLYGTEISSGVLESGSVFKLTPTSGGQWVESLVYDFNTSGLNGRHPYGGVLPDAAGNLYGTTNDGGMDDCGVVFRLKPVATGSWTEEVLHSFIAGTSDGCNPAAKLIFDPAGNLYGTTNLGGTQNLGVVFKLSPEMTGQWNETVLHNFTVTGNPLQGANSGLVMDTAGNLYGDMGSTNGTNFGTVYELIPQADGSWTWKVLEAFPIGKGPLCPCSDLTLDAAGNLYGTSAFGGPLGFGAIFELTPTSAGTWQIMLLHSFSGTGPGGSSPSGVIVDSSGNLDGTTSSGDFSDGVAFEIPH